jgi:hypothetical protein
MKALCIPASSANAIDVQWITVTVHHHRLPGQSPAVLVPLNAWLALGFHDVLATPAPNAYAIAYSGSTNTIVTRQ